MESLPAIPPEALFREDGELRLAVREPAVHLARALRDRGFEAEAFSSFTIALRAKDWEVFWREAGPLLDCGC